MRDESLRSAAMEALAYNSETGQLTWKATRGPLAQAGAVAGRVTKGGYRHLTFDGKRYFAHRMAWLIVHGCLPSGDIDHINGVRDDNRIANLRDVSRAVNMQNQRNARSNNYSSGLLGVTWNRGRWTSQIQVDGKSRNLGRFDSKEEAYVAYLKAKRVLHAGCVI